MPPDASMLPRERRRGTLVRICAFGVCMALAVAAPLAGDSGGYLLALAFAIAFVVPNLVGDDR